MPVIQDLQKIACRLVVTFADFRTESGKFATLDYSDTQPALYLGEFVEFEDLKLKNLRQFEGWS